MCDLRLTDRAKERIADLRKNHKEGKMFEQSQICRAMSAVIYGMANAGGEEKEGLECVLWALYLYDELITELSEES